MDRDLQSHSGGGGRRISHFHCLSAFDIGPLHREPNAAQESQRAEAGVPPMTNSDERPAIQSPRTPVGAQQDYTR